MTRSLPALFALLFLCGLGVVATPAAAQTTSSTEALDTEAHALFEAGRLAYSSGRFEEALGHFRRSYELSHRPQLLYNIGQCQDRLRRDADALATFEAFVAAQPDSPQRDEVTARIEILRASAQQATTTETTAETTTETETMETTEATPAPVVASGSDPAPWGVLGAGSAIAIIGAILLGVGYADIASVDGARNVPFSSVSGAYNDAPVLTGAGWGVLGVGVALAGVGLVWGLSSGSGSSDHARLRLGPTGVTVSGSF
jgi:tetratricopeptide (TPR) repeat protein